MIDFEKLNTVQKKGDFLKVVKSSLKTNKFEALVFICIVKPFTLGFSEEFKDIFNSLIVNYTNTSIDLDSSFSEDEAFLFPLQFIVNNEELFKQCLEYKITVGGILKIERD